MICRPRQVNFNQQKQKHTPYIKVPGHILCRHRQTALKAIADPCIGYHDIQTTCDSTDLFGGSGIVVLVRGDELDDVKLVWMRALELLEARGAIRAASAGEDEDVRTLEENFVETETLGCVRDGWLTGQQRGWDAYRSHGSHQRRGRL